MLYPMVLGRDGLLRDPRLMRIIGGMAIPMTFGYNENSYQEDEDAHYHYTHTPPAKAKIYAYTTYNSL